MEHLPVTRSQVEDFLFEEAALLDDWKLKEWFALFAAECRYLVPSASLKVGASPDESLFYIADDGQMLEERVKRLYKNNAYAEVPHSKTRHLVTNVRLAPGVNDDEVTAHCCFATHRSRSGEQQTFVGKSTYRLALGPTGLLIREKRCELDTDDLHQLGRISIIL